MPPPMIRTCTSSPLSGQLFSEPVEHRARGVRQQPHPFDRGDHQFGARRSRDRATRLPVSIPASFARHPARAPPSRRPPPGPAGPAGPARRSRRTDPAGRRSSAAAPRRCTRSAVAGSGAGGESSQNCRVVYSATPVDQGLLGGEVVVQRRMVDPDVLGDLAQPQPLEPRPPQPAERRRDQLRPTPVASPPTTWLRLAAAHHPVDRRIATTRTVTCHSRIGGDRFLRESRRSARESRY